MGPSVNEVSIAHLSLRELTIANATRKGLAVSHVHPHRIVLAADTLVALEGEIIGKPRDLNHAGVILRRLSGRTHDVCTGVCIVGPQKKISFAEISQVRFRRLNESDIANYFRVVNPIDKAGAYAAQAAGRSIIASIEGSFTNVIGLPWSARPKCSRNLDFALLTCLDRNFRRSRRSVSRLAFQDSVQKPNDETIGRENNDCSEAGPIVNVAYFQRNQCSGREDHEILGPSFL